MQQRERGKQKWDREGLVRQTSEGNSILPIPIYRTCLSPKPHKKPMSKLSQSSMLCKAFTMKEANLKWSLLWSSLLLLTDNERLWLSNSIGHVCHAEREYYEDKALPYQWQTLFMWKQLLLIQPDCVVCTPQTWGCQDYDGVVAAVGPSPTCDRKRGERGLGNANLLFSFFLSFLTFFCCCCCCCLAVLPRLKESLLDTDEHGAW